MDNTRSSCEKTNSFVDIEDALNRYRGTETSSSYGKTGVVLTGQDGSMMSNIGGWLVEARSYAITGLNILLSVLFVSAIFACFLSVWAKSVNRGFFYMGKKYELIGLGQIQDGEKDLYSPIYKEVK